MYGYKRLRRVLSAIPASAYCLPGSVAARAMAAGLSGRAGGRWELAGAMETKQNHVKLFTLLIMHGFKGGAITILLVVANAKPFKRAMGRLSTTSRPKILLECDSIEMG